MFLMDGPVENKDKEESDKRSGLDNRAYSHDEVARNRIDNIRL